MDAIEALKTRRSIRAYKPEKVDKKLIEDVLDCGRLAASARNVQPWEFVVITDAEVLKKLSGLAENGRFLANCPACIVVLCKECNYFLEDGSAATQNILVAARAHGLGSCWIAGDKKPYAQAVCDLVGAPKGFKLISLIALGHPNEKPERPKRALTEVVHWEKF
jgi:nitroreductase